VFRLAAVLEAVGDVVSGHGAVAAVVVRLGLLDTVDHRTGDLHGGLVVLLLHRVGAVVAGAALDDLDLGIRDQRQQLTGLLPHVLHPLVTGRVVGHLAQGLLEIGIELALLVAQHQVLERVEDVLLHLLHLGVVRKHQRQLLLEHQHAGGDHRHDVPTLVHHGGQHRDVGLLRLLHRLQVAQLQLGHAAAALLLGDGHRDVVVLQNRRQVLADMGLVVVAVAGGEQDHLAAGTARGLALGDRTALAR